MLFGSWAARSTASQQICSKEAALSQTLQGKGVFGDVKFLLSALAWWERVSAEVEEFEGHFPVPLDITDLPVLRCQLRQI